MGYLSNYRVMQKFWSSSICLLVLTSSLWAQQARPKESGHGAVAQESKPAATAKPSATESADYSQEAFVTEHYIDSFRFENDGPGREQIDARIRSEEDTSELQSPCNLVCRLVV